MPNYHTRLSAAFVCICMCCCFAARLFAASFESKFESEFESCILYIVSCILYFVSWSRMRGRCWGSGAQKRVTRFSLASVYLYALHLCINKQVHWGNYLQNIRRVREKRNRSPFRWLCQFSVVFFFLLFFCCCCCCAAERFVLNKIEMRKSKIERLINHIIKFCPSKSDSIWVLWLRESD